MESTSELHSYTGNCHCGLFRFSLKIPSLTTVQICNCSICLRNAYKWVSHVAASSLVIEKGEGELRIYEFGKRRMKYFFCPVCGSSIMRRWKDAPPEGAIDVNARMLTIFDILPLKTDVSPGKDLEPKYEPPSFPHFEGELGEGEKLYNGSCHCGAFTYSVKTIPIEERPVVECNCSICSRNGELWIYPPASSFTIRGSENLTGYSCITKATSHSFCKICGVKPVVRLEGEDLMPVNVRTIDGIELQKLTVKPYDGKSQDPQYSL